MLTLAILTASLGADYVLDEPRSRIYVVVFKDQSTALSGASHDHVIRATGWNGTFSYDPANLAGCSALVDVQVKGLKVDEDAMRKRAKLKGTIDSGDRKDIRENMLDEDQLHGSKYPTILFAAEGCVRGKKPSEVWVAGSLHMRGASKSVSVPMTLENKDGELRARGSFTVRHTDFGFEPYSALLGALKNRDRMKFVLDLWAKPK